MTRTAVQSAAESIRRALDSALEARSAELVRLYLLEPNRYGTGFAGQTFDQLGASDDTPNTWGHADLLAVTTLDVRVKPAALRTLLAPAPNEHCDLLRAIPGDVALWERDASRGYSALDSAEVAWEALCSLPGIGWVSAGKLLARKRPDLVPIYDSVVQGELGLARNSPFWRALRTVLLEDSIRERIEALRPAECPTVSLLRLLDIVLWMRGSASIAAKAARSDVGFA